MTRVDTIAETELEPVMLPSIDTVAAVGSDATQETNCHADSCIRRQFSIKRKVCGSELLTSSLTKCFFLFLFILAACGHTSFAEILGNNSEKKARWCMLALTYLSWVETYVL
jgi:hypothetical protein